MTQSSGQCKYTYSSTCTYPITLAERGGGSDTSIFYRLRRRKLFTPQPQDMYRVYGVSVQCGATAISLLHMRQEPQGGIF